jgi:X-X-X-Leu-X-X-Gly heptad repeat protein
MNRRDFLKAALISTSLILPGTSGWAFRSGSARGARKKLIVIFLRGGIDGLNVVVPYGDPNYYSLRPTIAVQPPGKDAGALDLDGHFGLNPGMHALMPFWHNKTLAFVHASGSPDPSRSHFDAQDYMESGIPGRKLASSGWLNRLVTELPSDQSPVQAISIGALLPKIFSGPATVATVERVASPSHTALDNPALGNLFSSMYATNGGLLGKTFDEGMSAHKTINDSLSQKNPPKVSNVAEAADKQEQMAANRGAPQVQSYSNFGTQLSNLFLKDDTVQVAFLDFGGWDTHIREGNGKGQLADKLNTLCTGLADLASGLGDLFNDTAIVVMSEFGRTAKENGNGGTDHGHGNAMWLMGGGISGGKVFGRWSGLADNELHEQRDLPINSDFRGVLSRSLGDHLQLSQAALSRIFPDFKDTVNPFVG